MISRTQTVAMTYQEFLASYYERLRISINWDTKLCGKVVEHPHIMIAREKPNGNSRVSQTCELTLQSNKSFWYRMLVFKPEIENIAQQKNRMGVMLNAIKPSDNALFPFKTGLEIRNAKVKVRGKIDFLAV